MNSAKPIVTVLMPMYNSEEFISEAIESILNQNFRDFEFIIIDDASTDKSVQIVESYNDPRIQLIKKNENTGLTSSLNLGLSIAKGKYIARMDSDDISALNRFEKQLAFMEANLDIAVCGTWFKYINSNKVIKHPVLHDDIKIKLLSFSAIGHPTAFIRKNILQLHQLSYDVNMEPAEDYDFWVKISLIGKLANIPEVLLFYRLHDKQVSNLQHTKQIITSNQIRNKLISVIMPDLNLDLFSLNNDSENKVLIFNALLTRLTLIEKIKQINRIKNIFIPQKFNSFLEDLKKELAFVFFSDQLSKTYKNLFLVICNTNKMYKLVGFWVIVKYSLKTISGYKAK